MSMRVKCKIKRLFLRARKGFKARSTSSGPRTAFCVALKEIQGKAASDVGIPEDLALAPPFGGAGVWGGVPGVSPFDGAQGSTPRLGICEPFGFRRGGEGLTGERWADGGRG